MESWSDLIIAKLDKELENVKDKDLRFFRVNEFKRNIARVDEFSANCPFCENQKTDIRDISGKIFEAIDVPGNSRREYDRLLGRLARHMRNTHGFYAPYYFSYLYAFIGIVAGTISGVILYKLFPVYGEVLLSLCLVTGIVGSYFAGGRKDRIVRETKKLM